MTAQSDQGPVTIARRPPFVRTESRRMGVVHFARGVGAQPTSMIHRGGVVMAVESTGDSPGNPRLFKVIEHAPKTGKSPTVWAWPQLIDYLKVAGQPVQGPGPPHQQRRPDPQADSLPVAVPDSGP